MSQNIIIIVSLICAFSVLGCINAMSVSDPPYLCEPALIATRPNHIKRVCYALGKSNELSERINEFLKSQDQSEF